MRGREEAGGDVRPHGPSRTTLRNHPTPRIKAIADWQLGPLSSVLRTPSLRPTGSLLLDMPIEEDASTTHTSAQSGDPLIEHAVARCLFEGVTDQVKRTDPLSLDPSRRISRLGFSGNATDKSHRGACQCGEGCRWARPVRGPP